MRKILLFVATAVSTVGLAKIKLNSLEIRTSLKSNDPGTSNTDPTFGFSLDRAMWVQEGYIPDTDFNYSFEVNFDNQTSGMTARHIDASYTHGMHTFTAGMKDNLIGGADYAFQEEIERPFYMSIVFSTWDKLNLRLPGIYYTLAGDAWGSFTVGAHNDNGLDAAVDKVSYFNEFRGSFINASLKPIIQYQQFNKVRDDYAFINSYFSAGIIWDSELGLDLGFTYNLNINEANTPAGNDVENTEFAVNVLYEVNSLRPYFNWGQNTFKNGPSGVVTTTMDIGILYDIHEKVSLQFDYNTMETNINGAPKTTEWSIALNSVVM